MFSKKQSVVTNVNLKAQAQLLVSIDRYLSKGNQNAKVSTETPANEAINTVISIIPFIRRNAGI